MIFIDLLLMFEIFHTDETTAKKPHYVIIY